MKNFFRYPLRLVDGLIDRVLAVIGVIGLAQFPQFFSQYLQRLGGRLDEARLIRGEYIKAAKSLNLSLEEYVAQHLAAENEVFVSYGEVLNGVIERFHALEGSYLALKEATLFNRWWVFLQNLDWEVFSQTWLDFTPGIPTTIEGLCYGAAGLLVVWGFYKGIKITLRFIGRKIASLFRPTRSRPKYSLPV